MLNTTYEVRVRARSDVGFGNFSDVESEITFCVIEIDLVILCNRTYVCIIVIFAYYLFTLYSFLVFVFLFVNMFLIGGIFERLSPKEVFIDFNSVRPLELTLSLGDFLLTLNGCLGEKPSLLKNHPLSVLMRHIL